MNASKIDQNLETIIQVNLNHVNADEINALHASARFAIFQTIQRCLRYLPEQTRGMLIATLSSCTSKEEFDQFLIDMAEKCRYFRDFFGKVMVQYGNTTEDSLMLDFKPYRPTSNPTSERIRGPRGKGYRKKGVLWPRATEGEKPKRKRKSKRREVNDVRRRWEIHPDFDFND